jgi:hypothetical protein
MDLAQRFLSPIDLARNENGLCKWIAADPWMMQVLNATAELGLPDCWVGAGFVRNRVWDALCGHDRATPLDDVDVIYFDPDECDPAAETQAEKRLAGRLPGPVWQVRNQARMHAVNGDPPYRNTADAIAHWLETPTCIAARAAGGAVQIIAPHGLADLFDLRVRPTPAGARRADAYAARIARKNWQTLWPQLTIVAAK